jgi:hypothetical protein
VETLLELKQESHIGNASYGNYPMDLLHRILNMLPADAENALDNSMRLFVVGLSIR